MSINIGPPAIEELRPRITVIGVGGAGGNAIANMIGAGIEGVDFVVANTDAQALNNSTAEQRIQLGPDITEGLGAGSRPEVGKAAAEETLEEIERALEGVHMCFIAAGMGGGTGTGAAPVIAKAARDKGVLTVGVVTKPFLFEGTRRMRAAEAGIEELQEHVDTLIVIPNQNLFLVAKAETTFKEAFELADEVLQQGVRSITDLMVMPGLINLDFADVRSVMGEMGKAMMGTGESEGENRALEAAERAIANPLLDGVSMQGARGVIISIIGGDDMKLLEVDEAANHIRDLVDAEANIIWGSAFNPDLSGKIRVSVVATGIEQTAEQAELASRPISLTKSRGPVLPGASDTSAAEDVAAEPLQPSIEPVEPVDEAEPEVAQETDQDEDNKVQPLFEARKPAMPEAEPLDLSRAPEAPEPLDLTAAASAAPEPVAQEPAAPQEVTGSEEGPEDGKDESSAPGGYASLSKLSNDRAEPLDLGLDQVDETDADAGDSAGDGDSDGSGGSADELLLDASNRAEGDAQVTPLPGRKRQIGASGGAGEGVAGGGAAQSAPAAGGTTLFERMANLSRGSGADSDEAEDDDQSDDGGSISIPRFLGRQNNQ